MTQTLEDSRPFSMDLAVGLAGSPLSFEQVEEITIKLPGGGSDTKIKQSTIYRDAEGRMRIQSQFSNASGEWVTLIQIRDPIAGFVAFLTPDMVAHRVIAPKINPPSRGGISWFGTAIGMPGKIIKTEKLDRRTIQGIACDGFRIIGTSDDQPPQSIIEERWFSNELGIVALIESTSRDEHHSARILDVTRAEPDPGLFVIPREYEIQEAGDFSMV
jgi:hypothetical protein